MARLRMPLTVIEKERIWALKQEKGWSLRAIAAELQCSWITVRKWWRHERDQKQLRPRGRPGKGILSTYPQSLVTRAVQIKQAHPHWGPVNVRLELGKEWALPAADLPSRARLATLFKLHCPQAVQSRQARAYPQQAPVPSRHPHQRWQVDAQEGLSLLADEKVNLLDVRDPCGLVIGSHAFLTTTQKRWRKLTLDETQRSLREDFAHWGLPEEIQTDHETLYVGSADENFPSRFTLWLVGLGIQHITGRPGRPTDQAQVERHHRTQADLVWRDRSFACYQELQQALQDGRQRHNEEFPSHAGACQGRPPLRVYPYATSSGRPFDPAQEWLLFDLHRVDAFLSQFVCRRAVSATGVVTLGGSRYYVGKQFAGQQVCAQFVADTRAFRFRSSQGAFIRDWPARGFEKADILGYLPVRLPAPQPFQLPLPTPLSGGMIL